MTESDRIRWEARHSSAQTLPLGEPESTLEWAPFATGSAWALDLACGRGRHCEILLERGYIVVAADISSAALHTLRERHPNSGNRLFQVQVDLDLWPFAPDSFDFILQCDFLDRRLFSHMKASTRPGGHVLIDTFGVTAGSGGGPSNPLFRLEPGELQRAFEDWDILRLGSCRSPAREAILACKRRR